MSYYQNLYADADKKATLSRYDKINGDFRAFFNDYPDEYFSSSGRCELIGNHTDHNNGKVLVAAINRDAIACAKKTDDGIITVYSELGKHVVNTCELEKIGAEICTTNALIRGVVAYFAKNGLKYGGFNCTTSTQVPFGGGLSSSACFELLLCQILSTLYNEDSLSPLTMAFASHYAETEYFGKPCGLLDQCGVAFGGVCYIDFKDSANPSVKCCPADIDRQAVLIATKEDHANLTEYYASIKNEMCQVANAFGEKTLRQVDQVKFMHSYDKQPHTRPMCRAKHFFDENVRVEDGFSALYNRDFKTFYDKINESGESSRYLLQNCQIDGESDSPICYILDELAKLDVNGARRVHGGGFRGTVLAFLSDSSLLPKLYDIFGKEYVMPVSIRNKGVCKVDIHRLAE